MCQGCDACNASSAADVAARPDGGSGPSARTGRSAGAGRAAPVDCRAARPDTAHAVSLRLRCRPARALSPLRFSAAPVALLAALCACAAPPPAPSGDDAVSGRADAIVNGTFEPGEPAVVLLMTYGGVFSCTGTLITPHVVLTAKHCVQGSGMARPYPASAFTVGVGSRRGATRNYRVRAVYATPGVYTTSSTTGLGGAIVGVDIGLLALREAPEGVTPIRIRRDPPTDMVGQPYTAIGFGRTPSGESGVKYKATSRVDVVASRVLYSTQTICSGDSGGPMIQETPERRLIGVASFGQADSCPSPVDGHNRIDHLLDLIDRAIVEAGDCDPRGDEVCNSVDDDCDGQVDEGCTPLGEACERDEDCAYAQHPAFLDPLPTPAVCLDTGGGRICTRRCAPGGGADPCSRIDVPYGGGPVRWDGATCVIGEDCQGVCRVAPRGGLGDGAPCAAASDCASLRCVDPGDGRRRCLDACIGDTGGCPAGQACAALPGACGSCVDPALLPLARGLGEPCAAASDCASGLCETGDPPPYCTRACASDGDCGAAFHCVGAACVRGPRAALGDPCLGNEDCTAPAFCAERSGVRWCTRLCASESDCGPGLRCEAAGGTRVCAPDGAYLGEACASDEDCSRGRCLGGRCLEPCGAGVACGTGFACTRDPDGVGARCLPPGPPPAPGGCAVVAIASGAPRALAPAALAMPLVVGACLVAARRRRTRAAAGRARHHRPR